jgi:hypothetical protein
MFDFGMGALITVQALRLANEQEQRYLKSLETLPPDMQVQLLKEHRERKEKARLEAIAERRHQELCEAIKEAGRRANFFY